MLPTEAVKVTAYPPKAADGEEDSVNAEVKVGEPEEGEKAAVTPDGRVDWSTVRVTV